MVLHKSNAPAHRAAVSGNVIRNSRKLNGSLDQADGAFHLFLGTRNNDREVVAAVELVLEGQHKGFFPKESWV